MSTPLRIAQVAPVATSIPPPKSGSIETVTSHLTEGLVARGHDVTLFATGDSRTSATLHPIFEKGYRENPDIWPWELCELFNLTTAVELADAFDVIHYQAEYYPMSLALSRLCPTPLVTTLHHSPRQEEVALWSRYADAPFVAISQEQAAGLSGLHVAGVVYHGTNTAAFAFRAEPDDYLAFLGRFTEGKGVLQAIEVARRVGMRLKLAAAETDFYRTRVAPQVDGEQVIYVGEVDHAGKVDLLGGARALIYPVQVAEPFGLVLTEAMACGTPVAALDCGAVAEIVDDGVTGGVYPTVDALVDGLPRVLTFDRAAVRRTAVERFGVERMVDGYLEIYSRLVAARAGRAERAPRHGPRRDKSDRTVPPRGFLSS
jgi:glycosyltransferase involved in cell wall biosynthesis